jgi:Multicopper oxidase
MDIDRRSLLKYAGLVPLIGTVPLLARAADEVPAGKADYTLRIANGSVELAPAHSVSTTLYNGQFPGPLLRFKEGQRVTVDIYNDTDTPELVHWHGQMIPSDVDGASEEGSPFVPTHGMQRISFVPKPSGLLQAITKRRLIMRTLLMPTRCMRPTTPAKLLNLTYRMERIVHSELGFRRKLSS